MINNIVRPVLERFNINKFIETGILEGDTMKIVSMWFHDMYGTEFYNPLDTKTKGRYQIHEVDIDANGCIMSQFIW